MTVDDCTVLQRIVNAWKLYFQFSGTLAADTKLHDLGFDGVDWLDAMFAIEDEFQLVMSESRFQACRTGADLLAYVQQLCGNDGASCPT